ncbi:hypothetical protein JCM18909_152 [Cutibacterium acnes JCM 18909]|nr:hypothetical protein JCM18909_152 [Cutibacterium acnes JCM 18909]
MTDTKSSRHPWLHTASGLVGLVLALPVLVWSIAAVLPSHNTFTFVSSVLVGSLAVPTWSLPPLPLSSAFSVGELFER